MTDSLDEHQWQKIKQLGESLDVSYIYVYIYMGSLLPDN